jgi:Protein of unknown function (DUF3443)
MPSHRIPRLTAMMATAGVLSACLGNHGSTPTSVTPPPPVVNTMTVTVDSGPAAAPGAINHAYVTVRVCAPGSTTQCANVDHVLLDTGSWGLRLVRSVLAAGSVTLTGETDAQGNTVEECETFGGGQTWGPVALADVTLAGEVARKLPVQVMDDTSTGTPPCGANGTLLNTVAGFGANGVLGVGVFAQDCGAACVNAASPLPVYYGCTAAGVCTAENLALVDQVTNPVAAFAVDNNGLSINMANLVNANGDASVQGQLTFGLGTQADNALPATGLTVLGANASGDFTATFNGGSTVLPALIDSGTDDYVFSDMTIPACSTGSFVGDYCPAVAPLNVFAVNTGVGANNATNTVNFAVQDPNTFVAGGAAFEGLAGGGGATNFVWGMPYFYGRTIYIGINQKVSGAYTGPYYAY